MRPENNRGRAGVGSWDQHGATCSTISNTYFGLSNIRRVMTTPGKLKLYDGDSG